MFAHSLIMLALKNSQLFLFRHIIHILSSYIKQKLETSNAQAFVVINFEDSGQPGTHHLSGFSGSASIIIINDSQQYILSDGRYTSQIEQECKDFEFIPVDNTGYIKSLAQVLLKNNFKRILIDPTQTQYSTVMILKEQLPDIEIATSHNLLQKIREQKNEQEIQCIQKSVDISIKAFQDLLNDIKIGITERYIASRLEFLMKQHGADGFAFNTIVVSGVRGALPHGMPTDKKIEKEEMITIDFGATKDGFASDITRTVSVGEPNSKLKEIYDIVKNAQKAGCDAVSSRMSR